MKDVGLACTAIGRFRAYFVPSLYARNPPIAVDAASLKTPPILARKPASRTVENRGSPFSKFVSFENPSAAVSVSVHGTGFMELKPQAQLDFHAALLNNPA